MNPFFRTTLCISLLFTLNSIAAASTDISAPYSIQVDGNYVHIKNESDRLFEMRLAIEGKNFLSQFPCEVHVFLGPHNEHTLEVSAKNKSIPVDYRIFVTDFSAKTRAQIILEQKGKPLPVLTQVTPADIAKMKVLTCQSH